MQLIVAINCSSKKTAVAAGNLCARNLRGSGVTQLAKEWWARVERSSVAPLPARELYAGRAFAIARKAAESAGAELHVLSAGMGLIRQDKLVPPYNLSVAPDTDDCILCRSSAGSFTSSQWWEALHDVQLHSRPLERLLRGRPEAMLVLAATRPYIEMVEEELASLSTPQLARIRIVGVGATQVGVLPQALRPLVMPYDGRLDDADLGLQGTRFDFAARALSHFLGLVNGDGKIHSPLDHAKRVRLSLSRRKAPHRPQRERLDVDELHRHVLALKEAGESKTGALVKLRSLGYACEQKRFYSVWEAP